MLNLFFFQWPSNLGGADTRLVDLIIGFNKTKKYNLFCIPNDKDRLLENDNVNFLEKNNVKILTWDSLPVKNDGIAIAFCNFRLFSETWRLDKIKSSGLKFIWSNDMMWKEDLEITAIKNGLVDAAIYTSEDHFLKTSLSIPYLKEYIVPNYLHLEKYPKIERTLKNKFTIGKHSRPDLEKFSDNFPLFYQDLGIENPHYRIMGISDKIKKHFRWFNFNNSWELLYPNQESIIGFLSTLDCYVYNSHYSFTETQCRATIEAMLTGLPVIAPNKENFKKQIDHGETGFICNSYSEFKHYTQIMEKNYLMRNKIGNSAREKSIDLWCDFNKQLNCWEKIFNEII